MKQVNHKRSAQVITQEGRHTEAGSAGSGTRREVSPFKSKQEINDNKDDGKQKKGHNGAR